MSSPMADLKWLRSLGFYPTEVTRKILLREYCLGGLVLVCYGRNDIRFQLRNCTQKLTRRDVRLLCKALRIKTAEMEFDHATEPVCD